MINQLRFTYMRQFGGRVNNPTTSLGDLNSKFTDSGRPDAAALDGHRLLHRTDVDRRSRCGQRLLRRERQLTISRGQSLVQVRRRGVVREDRPRHAARQLRRVRVQRQQDGQRLRRLPAGPARDDDAGRADAKDSTTARTSACSRRTTSAIHPARDAEPRRPLRPAVPLHRSAGPQAGVRAGRAVDRSRRPRRKGCSSPATRASAAASSRPTTTTSRRAWAWRGIRRGDGRMSVRARRRHLLRQHHRQRVEHDRRQPAVHRAAVVPDRVHAVRSVPQPARAASGRSRSTTTRRARGSRCRRRSSVRRSISSGRTRIR